MNKINLTRQLGIIPLSVLSQKIHIIGVGGIGSHTSVALAKMGFLNQVVWDFDRVSEENMNAQGYRFKDIGRPKVEALREIVKEYANYEIEIRNEKFEKQSVDGVVISAVDSMAARKAIWSKIKGSVLVDWLIDPRMSSQDATQYVMKPSDKKDQESYEKTLFSDDVGVQEACTEKAVMFTANYIAGLVSQTVKNLSMKETYPRVTLWNIKQRRLEVYEKEMT